MMTEKENAKEKHYPAQI